ncbi:MAG: type VI secretion system-associated protein TagF [Desulfatitalea sp.]|nr:type VI secretion system-associated protein TagF [Desulfatitalea sp.]NNK00539.1 type VI secretion system-associated protein TagF [Desulfatitalea sp.]
MGDRAKWQWFFWGKHPGVADFVYAGTQTPLFQRFTQWLDTGFSNVDADLKIKSRHCSWRFWSKGAGDEVVCGLVRNSCDSYGRSFPLLSLGSGRLADWSRNCSLLPYAFEATWKHFEYVAAARYDSVKALADALYLVQPPEARWREYQMNSYRSANLYRPGGIATRRSGTKELCVIDSRTAADDLPRELSLCSAMVAERAETTPTAVFIGEVGQSIAVATVDDLLKPADFVWLWSLEPETWQGESNVL